MSTDVEVAYTPNGLVVDGFVVYPDVMADWFEQYRLIDDYFSHYMHGDCVTNEELKHALKDQRDEILYNLGDPPYNYHDDNKHPGAIQWCEDAACNYVSRATLEEDLG